MPIAPKEAETVRDALRVLCVGVKEFTWQTYEEAGIASGECGVLGLHAESGFEVRIGVDDELIRKPSRPHSDSSYPHPLSA
jgi:hypothetical protein